MRLFVVVKQPAPGRVKTRLGKEIGPEAAAELAQAFLDDTLRRLAPGRPTVVVHAPPELSPAFRARCRAQAPECTFVPQGPGDLGARLAAALAGSGVRLAVGGDAPDLPLERLERAAALLAAEADVVAVPAQDGGYSLLGLGPGVDAARLAGAIRWSSPHTWADTEAAFAGHTVVALEPWDDVDELEDLRALCARLEPGVCAATEAWARANGYLDTHEGQC
ncbi:MAG: DUF2064 domain-containing protein [Planctomycetota bacterium]